MEDKIPSKNLELEREISRTQTRFALRHLRGKCKTFSSRTSTMKKTYRLPLKTLWSTTSRRTTNGRLSVSTSADAQVSTNPRPIHTKTLKVQTKRLDLYQKENPLKQFKGLYLQARYKKCQAIYSDYKTKTQRATSESISTA